MMSVLALRRRRPFQGIPGEAGLPLVGNTFSELRDPYEHIRRMHERYGNIFWENSLFLRKIVVVGAEATKCVLLDKRDDFSSEKGWRAYMSGLFRRNLVLLDGNEHRSERAILRDTFTKQALEGYVRRLDKGFGETAQTWLKFGQVNFWPAMKQAALERAADLFYGITDADEVRLVNRSITDSVQALTAIPRLQFPGTKYWRGVRGGQKLVEHLTKQIPERRRGGDDLFSRLCAATDEVGASLEDWQIVGHLQAFWMAAHDTITSSVTSLTYELARHPAWQARLRRELLDACGVGKGLTYDSLKSLHLFDAVYNEVLRLHTPAPSVPRVARNDVTLGDHTIPKDAHVTVLLFHTHRMEEYWPEPRRFDPNRFLHSKETAPRPRFAFVPFGGGAHSCLGSQFAFLAAKSLMYHLLTRCELRLAANTEVSFNPIPVCQPRTALWIQLKSLKPV